jgi:hypothetical protein
MLTGHPLKETFRLLGSFREQMQIGVDGDAVLCESTFGEYQHAQC